MVDLQQIGGNNYRNLKIEELYPNLFLTRLLLYIHPYSF